MRVIKRNGNVEPVDFNKITERIKKLSNEISESIDPIKVAQKVCNSLYDNVTTRELDELSSEIAIALCTEHPAYGVLAAHLCTSNLHKNILGNFTTCVQLLHAHQLVSDGLLQISNKYKNERNTNVNYSFMFNHSQFITRD